MNKIVLDYGEREILNQWTCKTSFESEDLAANWQCGEMHIYEVLIPHLCHDLMVLRYKYPSINFSSYKEFPIYKGHILSKELDDMQFFLHLDDTTNKNYRCLMPTFIRGELVLIERDGEFNKKRNPEKLEIRTVIY